MPVMRFHMKSIAFGEQQGWAGEINSAAYSTDYENWNVIDISEPGREVSTEAMALYANGTGVLASLASYVVTKSDTTAGGVVGKWTTDWQNCVWLITPTSRKQLYRDTSVSRYPLTNVEQIDESTFAVGYASPLYTMSLITEDGQITNIPRPPGTESGPALYLHRTKRGDIYCFYSSADGFARRIRTSAVVYHQSDGTTDYLDLDRVGDVSHATSSDDLVVGAINGGLVVIQGSSVRKFALVDTITTYGGTDYPYMADVYGVDFINRDTLLCNTQSSIFVIPRALLTATSGVQTEPGIIIAGTHSQLVNLVDGLAEVSWILYDNTGRSLFNGSLEVGDRSLQLPLEGVSSGVYHLLLNTQGRETRSIELLVTH